MRKRFGIISVLVAIMMMMNMVTVSADVVATPDYVEVNVQQDGAKVTVDYSLTLAAVDAGLSFGTITTTIEGQAFTGAHVEASLYDLKVPAGTTVTADYSVQLTSSTKVESTTSVVSDTTTLMKIEVEEEFPADEEGAAPQVATTTEWVPAVQTWEHNGWQSLNGDFGRTKDNPPLWIWNAYKATLDTIDELVEFKRLFVLSNTIDSASLVITADNKFAARINGQAVGADASWPTVSTYDVKDVLVNGENVLEIDAINDGLVSNSNSNPGGLIYKLTIVTSEVLVEVEEVVSGSFDLSHAYNLWIASDDSSKVFIDGVNMFDVAGWSTAKKYFVPVSSTPFFAVEAKDTTGQANIAGFRLEFYDFEGGNAISEATDNDWYYYNVFGENGVGVEPDNDEFGTPWTSEDYVDNDSNWVKASELETYSTWAKDDQFPAPISSSWIWSEHFDVPVSDYINTPVYFRSAPAKESVQINVEADGYDAAVTVNGETPFVRVLKDTYVALDAPAVEGYDFLGWYEDDSLKYEGPQQNVQADMDRTFTAKYAIKTYEITTEVDPAVVGRASGAGTYDHGETVELKAPANKAYTFLGWYKGDVKVHGGRTYTTSALDNAHYVAKYDIKRFTITVTSTDGGSAGFDVPTVGNPFVDDNKVTADYGTPVTMKVTDVEEGYRFVKWVRMYGERESNRPATTELTRRTNANKIFKAIFAELGRYDVNVIYNEKQVDASVTPESTLDDGLYYEGDDVTVSAAVQDAFTTITSVTVNKYVNGEVVDTYPGTLPISFEDIDADYEVVIESETKYGLATYSNNVAMGSTSPSKELVYEDAETGKAMATITATPESGYRFVGWFLVNESESGLEEELFASAATHTFEMTDHLELMGKFEPIPVVRATYTLTVNVVGDGTVPGFTGTQSFTSGTNVNLEAVITDPTLTAFEGWSGDLTSTDANVSISMNGNKVITATFTDIIEDDSTPLATPDEDTDEILDEEITEAAPEIPDEPLPQTGGVPASMMSMFGIAMTGLGFKIRKRK